MNPCLKSLFDRNAQRKTSTKKLFSDVFSKELSFSSPGKAVVNVCNKVSFKLLSVDQEDEQIKQPRKMIKTYRNRWRFFVFPIGRLAVEVFEQLLLGFKDSKLSNLVTYDTHYKALQFYFEKGFFKYEIKIVTPSTLKLKQLTNSKVQKTQETSLISMIQSKNKFCVGRKRKCCWGWVIWTRNFRRMFQRRIPWDKIKTISLFQNNQKIESKLKLKRHWKKKNRHRIHEILLLSVGKSSIWERLR